MEYKTLAWKYNFSLIELKDEILVSLFRELNIARNEDRQLMKLIILTLYNRNRLHLLSAV